MEQGFVLNTIINSQLRFKKRKLYCLFVDLSSAFDLVSHNKLWEKLESKGVSAKFILTVRKLYSMANAKIRVNGAFSEPFEVTRSVLQGESLSPKLFTIFLDDVVDAVRSESLNQINIGNLSVDMLLFADDIVLMAVNANDLQTKIIKLKHYFGLNKMKVNLIKTKVAVLRNETEKPKARFKWGEEVIEQVDSYTYLGIPFHYSGKFEVAASNFFGKADDAIASLLALMYRGRINKISIQERLFKSLCQSILFYGSPLWGVEYVGKMIIFQNAFLRKLFYVNNECQRHYFMLETNIRPIENSYLNILLRFIYKIAKKNQRQPNKMLPLQTA